MIKQSHLYFKNQTSSFDLKSQILICVLVAVASRLTGL